MSREEIERHITFSPVNKSTIGLQKIIHRELLPVKYSSSIYEMMTDRTCVTAELAFLYDDTAIGEVSFRIEDSDDVKKAYLMTIGVLKAYQRLGIGTLLLNRAISQAQALVPIKEIYLHVQAENEAAIAFYERHQFTRGPLETQYYQSLANGDAYVFFRQFP
jgi:ribosomal protein S18 acetylase RimI-like enzyme